MPGKVLCNICESVIVNICSVESNMQLVRPKYYKVIDRLWVTGKILYIYIIYSHPQTGLFRSIRTLQCG